MIAANQGGRVAPAVRALLSFDSRAWLPTLNCPTLVVAGGQDRTTPAQHARELVAGLPAARLHVLPQADHWLVKTHSQALLDILTPWLAQQEGQA